MSELYYVSVDTGRGDPNVYFSTGCRTEGEWLWVYLRDGGVTSINLLYSNVSIRVAQPVHLEELRKLDIMEALYQQMVSETGYPGGIDAANEALEAYPALHKRLIADGFCEVKTHDGRLWISAPWEVAQHATA